MQTPSLATSPRSPEVFAITSILIIAVGWFAAFGSVYLDFAGHDWTLDENAHAPFIFAIIIGAFTTRLSSEPFLKPTAQEVKTGGAFLLLGLGLLLIGRAGEVTLLMSAAQGVCALGLVWLFLGLHGVRRLWFPLAMFGYLIIWPGWAIDAITFPLKLIVSQVVSDVLFAAGVPVAHAGAVISAGPYQLLVADACAGLNSLIALTAVGAVYLYMAKQPSRAVNVMVLALLIPIAILANMIRVAILVLLTYYFGYDVGQGFLHEGAGILMFSVALGFVFLVEIVASLIFKRRPVK